eukprot:7233055-Alexandrium_andersonii.AAC.1
MRQLAERGADVFQSRSSQACQHHEVERHRPIAAPGAGQVAYRSSCKNLRGLQGVCLLYTSDAADDM